MSQTTNCKKCGKIFLKVSMKSTESICHECRTYKRNAMNHVAFDEMSKVELLRAVQDMSSKSKKMEDIINKMNARLDAMHKIVSDLKLQEINRKATPLLSMDEQMRELYIKHNNRLIKLENKVLKKKVKE